MIEQILEKNLIDLLSPKLDRFNLQIIGAWQSPNDNRLKAVEDALVNGYLSIKTSPRAFSDYTSPECSIQFRLELNIRAELDAVAADYLEIARIITDDLQKFHRSFDDGKAIFEADGFNFTGFRLDGGDCGINPDACVWTLVQQFTVQGIIV